MYFEEGKHKSLQLKQIRLVIKVKRGNMQMIEILSEQRFLR